MVGDEVQMTGVNVQWQLASKRVVSWAIAFAFFRMKCSGCVFLANRCGATALHFAAGKDLNTPPLEMVSILWACNTGAWKRHGTLSTKFVLNLIEYKIHNMNLLRLHSQLYFRRCTMI